MKTFRFIGYAIFAILMCLSACSGGGDVPIEPTPKPELTKSEITIDSNIISDGLSFLSYKGEQTISFSTNESWTLTIASTTSGASWCTASATAGDKGNAKVKFSVTENTDYENRSVSVTIKSGTASKTFTISQKCADALLVTTDKYEVSQEGAVINIEVKTNIDYKMEISETAKSWIKESSSRSLTTYKHSFKIEKNENSEKREGEIYFKSGSKVETVKVYQAGGAILLLSKNEYNVSDKGDTISVEIKSNIEFGVQMPDVDWIIDEASSRGMSSHSIKYVIAQNEGYDSRSTEIVFYDKNSDLKETLKIAQAQKNAIIISKNDISVAKEGGTVEVKVNTNVEFEIQIPSDASWITHTQSRALTEKKVYLNILENMNVNERKAEIIFINKELQISEIITIFQAGFIGDYTDGVVTINKAGTIRELLGNNYLNIDTLKVIGFINGTDIRTIREMAGSDVDGNETNGKLQILNISECNIVEGGDSYIFSNYTTNNTIGSSMFQNCSLLKELYLPKTITKIEDFALANCIQLKVFNIPKNVTILGSKIFQGCSSLKELVIPCNIKSWGELGKSSFSSIIIENGVNIIPFQAFHDCSNLKEITIPKTVTHIGNGAFKYPNEIKKVYVDDLEQWLNYDWKYVDRYGCDYPLTGNNGMLYIGGELVNKVTIPNNYTFISKCAFYGCTNIENIILPNTIESIGKRAFFNSGIKNIEIPNSVKHIGEYAFAECSYLNSVKMSNMVTEISAGCFSNCKMLKFKIPNYIQNIDVDAFWSCESLEEIIIPEGFIRLNNGIFDGCINVKKIILPASLNYIGSSTFGAIPFTEIYCHSTTPPTLSKYSSGPNFNFASVNKDSSKLYVPKGSVDAYRNSDWGKYFSNIIELK